MKRGMLCVVMGMFALMMCAQTQKKTKMTTVVAHAAVAETDDALLQRWAAGRKVSAEAVEKFGRKHCFVAQHIPDKVFQRMAGKSFPKTKAIEREELRYLRLLHYNKEGEIRLGEMVCNKRIANALVTIFSKLFDAHYPIERMVLIDNYQANDESSMRANNTSCFCFRSVKGTTKLSAHSRGMAVDINPLYNPHCKWQKGKLSVAPTTALPYADRSKKFAYKIEHGDICHRLFLEHGFRWGGAWRHSKDYQHFEK
ncbi:M15 family metallopeptidase [Alloprevotella rava]|nr:M15 family metallopeptidase [Alloprevotella rava]